MRFALTLILFLMAGVTLAGLGLAVLLTAPVPSHEVLNLFGWVASGGFAVALVASYFIAGRILANAKAGSDKRAAKN